MEARNMKPFFALATPVWGQNEQSERNVTLFFVLPSKQKEAKIRITACSFYRIFIDGDFFAYGPSRDAHSRYRVDEYDLPESYRVLVIEVAGYQCNSFYALNEPAFALFETLDKEGNVVDYSSPRSKAYRNTSRLQKVTRFSYQRAFSESYRLSQMDIDFLSSGEGNYPLVSLISRPLPTLDSRIVSYPKYPKRYFCKMEEGVCWMDESKPDYVDRYQFTEYLGIFPKESWEIDSNHVASCLCYRKKNVGTLLPSNTFRTYTLPSSLTGFLQLELTVNEDATVYLLFDEMGIQRENDAPVEINFARNTTHNCITYELQKGTYRLLSFEPYTARYVRVVVLKGNVRIHHLSILRYENPDVDRFRYEFSDPRLTHIFDSAVATFAQNAVDLLTDCPSRERAGWLCDSYFSGQVEPLITGKNLQEKAFLDNYAHAKKEGLPEGMIPMCYPADFPSKEYIPNWSLWYILELYEYQKRNGRDEIIEESLPNVLGILRYFSTKENEDGMLENLEGWVFVEWSKANDPEFICGVNAPSNMLYADALCKAGLLLDRPELTQKGETLKKKIFAMFYHNGFFVDNAVRNEKGELVLTKNTTETCQYYALYFGIMDLDTNQYFVHKMMQDFGEYRDARKVYPTVYKSNLLMGILLRLLILLRQGEPERVMDETVDYFNKMAELTGTLWEHDDVYASLNHCFASYVIAIELRANFGLLYIDETKKEIHLSSSAALREGNVTLPLREGQLFLRAKNGVRVIRKSTQYRLVNDD